MCDFADSRGLADPIDTDEEPHGDPTRLRVKGQGPVRVAERAQKRLAHRGGDAAGSTLLAQSFDDGRRRRDAHVAAQQHLLDHVELLLGQRTRAEGAHAFEDAARRPESLGEIGRFGLGQGEPVHLVGDEDEGGDSQ